MNADKYRYNVQLLLALNQPLAALLKQNMLRQSNCCLNVWNSEYFEDFAFD